MSMVLPDPGPPNATFERAAGLPRLERTARALEARGFAAQIADGGKTIDPVDRQTAVSAVEKYVSTAEPILPLVFRDYDFVVSKRVQNVSGTQISDPSSRYWDVIDWRLASDG